MTGQLYQIYWMKDGELRHGEGAFDLETGEARCARLNKAYEYIGTVFWLMPVVTDKQSESEAKQ